MSYTGRSLKKNGSNDGLKERNQTRKTTLSYVGRSFAPIKPIEKEKNRGSHVGYVLGNVGIGLMQPFEGIYKFLVGTTAQLTGDKAYAKYIYSKSLTGDWSEALNKSYNPGKGMAFVGDVATGLGQSVTYAGMAMATGGMASAAGASGATLAAAQSAPIFLSGAGSGTSEAVQRTGNLTHRENLYGLGSGLMEMGLEKLSSVGGAVGRLTGTQGVSEKIFSKVIKNSVARGIVSDAAGEFAEEALSELGSTWLLRITGVDKEARTNAGNMFRAGIVGAFSGAIMGGATAGTARQVRINAGKRIQANQTAEATVQAAKSLMDAVKGAGLSAELQGLRSAVDTYTALEDKNSRAALEKLGQIAEKMLSIEGKSHIGELTAKFMADAENTVDVINLQIPKPGSGKWTVEDIRRNEGNITSMYASLVHANRLMMLSESYAQSIDALVKEGQAEAMKATEAENVADIMNMQEKGERYIVRDMGEGRYGVVFRTNDGKYNVGVYQNSSSNPEIVENVNSAKEAYALLTQKANAAQTTENAAQTSQTEKDEQTPQEKTENATERKNGGENGQITDADRSVARGLLKDYDMLSAEVQRKIAAMVQSGLRAGASKQQMKEAACLIRDLKVMIAFSADITSEGMLAKMDGESIILIHPQKQNRSNTLLHELTHRLRSASYYSTLAKTVKEAVGERVFAAYKEAYRKDYDSYRESEAKHGRHIEALTEEALEEDAVADICADYLGKLDFIKNYCDDSLIRRILRRLHRMRAVLKSDNREYLQAAKKIEKAYEELLANYAFSDKTLETKKFSPPSASSEPSDSELQEESATEPSPSPEDGNITSEEFWNMFGGNEAKEKRDPAYQAEMKRRRIALGLEKETTKRKNAREKKEKQEKEAEKYYTKKDAAETVEDVLDETLKDLARQYGVTITAAAKERTNEQLWLALNRASQKERENACKKIADALMEAIVLTENEGSRRAAYDEALHEYEILNQYRHNIFVKNLEAPREEKNGLLLQWSNKESKYNVWDVKKEAAENGVILQGDTETDLLREIDSRCRSARNTAAKKAYRAALKEFDGEVDLNTVKNGVVSALMKSFDDKGKVKPYAGIEAYQKSAEALEEARKQVENFKNRAQKITRNARATIRQAAFEGEKARKLRNYIEKNLLGKMRDTFSNRKYLSTDEMLNKQFETVINLFTKGITPEQFCESRKRARVVVQQFADFYKMENPVLASIGADKETLFTDDQMVGYIDPTVVDAIQAFLSVDEREPLRIEDWENLKTIVGGAKKLFERYDAIKYNGRTQNLSELIKKETDILSYVKNRNLVTGSNTLKKVLARLKRAGWQYAINVVDPITVVGALTGFDESSALYQMINELRMAEDRRICTFNELMAPIETYLKSNKKYKKRLAESTLRLKGVEITVGEAISAIMTSKRRQAWDSLSISGFRVERQKTGETLEIRGLTEADFVALEKSLSEEDRQMIKLCESFFEEARKKKIDTDEEVLGYTSILEGYYFPLYRAEDTIAKKGDLLDNSSRFEEFFLSTSNLSFNKKTKPHVKSQLKLSNVFDVVSRHADGLSAYATLYAPLQDLNRLYNKNIGESSNIITVKKFISDSVEKDAHNYLVNLINGLQGRKTISKGNAVMGKMRSLFATSVLGFKLDTVCKQISSLPMALTYVKIGSLTRGLTIKVDDAILDKYSTAAKARAYDKTVVKAEGVLDKVGDFANATTAGIQWMDRKVVKRLFGAAQAEIESTEGDPIGSEANLQKAGKLLDKIIHDTQGNSLAMERSALMRSESEFWRSFTMFMSDSMKQLSRILESVWRVQVLSQKAKDGKATQVELDEAKKQLGKSIAAVLASTTVFVLIGQLFKWLYAKDRKNAEGETVSVLEDTTKEFAMQLIGTLPIISAASDFFIDGWPVSNFAVDMVNDVLDSTKRLYEAAFDPEKTAEQQRLAFKKAIHATLSMVGLPSENVEKTLTGLVRRFDPATAYRYNNLFYDSKYAQDLAAANEEDKDRLAGTIIELAYEKRTGESSAAVVDEVLRLYKLGYTEILTQDVPDSIKVSGENVILTRKQKNAYTSAFNSFDFLPKLVESASFKALTDEERAAAVKRANQLAAAYAKNKVLGAEMNTALAAASFIEPTLLVIAAAGCNGIKSDIDKNGKTVPGSRKKKLLTYLKRLGMSETEQAVFLYAVLGYRSDELKEKVKAAAATSSTEVKNALGIN